MYEQGLLNYKLNKKDVVKMHIKRKDLKRKTYYYLPSFNFKLLYKHKRFLLNAHVLERAFDTPLTLTIMPNHLNTNYYTTAAAKAAALAEV